MNLSWCGITIVTSIRLHTVNKEYLPHTHCWHTAWLDMHENYHSSKLVLNFARGKSFPILINHFLVCKFSFSKNLCLNRPTFRYLTTRFCQKRDFLADFKEINVIWQSLHIIFRSGIQLSTLCKIIGINLLPLCFLHPRRFYRRTY